MAFVHLHVHSEYSMLDGLGPVKQIAKRAKDLGHGAVALTDHGVMYGAIEFFDACNDNGVKPIIGMEGYMTKRGRRMKDRDIQFDKSPYHMLMLAMNNTGYKNLMRMSSLAQLEGFYFKPRIDHDLLKECNEGIICTSGCLGSEIPRLIVAGQMDEARAAAKWFRDIFDDRFYFELQEHDLEECRIVNPILVDWAKEMSIPLIVTSDAHYVKREDAIPHDLMLCIQTASLVSQKDRMRFNNDSYYMHTEAEMRAIFDAMAPEAVSTTAVIAERCSVSLKTKNFYLPNFRSPQMFANDDAYLRYLCEIGFEVRYGIPARADGTWVSDDRSLAMTAGGMPEALMAMARKLHGVMFTDEETPIKLAKLSPLALSSAESNPNMSPRRLRERLDFELNTITTMGFSKYMLIVWDLIRFCRESDIWWDVRGSAAGSMVSHVLMLTNIEPVSNDLFFERFLNPERVTMPDIDMDFPDDQRHLLVDYTIDKYGKENVAQIITFGTMAARGALKDVGRVMDVPLSDVNRVTSLVPAVPGKPVNLRQAREEVQALKELLSAEPRLNEMYEKAITIEGRVRNAGTHAAGVVIADRPLIEYVPLNRLTGTPLTSQLNAVTQFEMGHLEAIGLLKMDYLGLSMLTIIRRAANMIAQRHGIKFDMNTIPIHDKAIYELLSRGDVLGVFQVEGCLSGDTLIGHSTIKQLYEKFSTWPTDAKFSWSDRHWTTSCYMDAGVFQRNKILNVVYSGVKPVYRLTDCQGRWIKATADHKFLTERGWVRLGDLSIETDKILFKTDVSRTRRSCVICQQPMKGEGRNSRWCKTCSAKITANPNRPEVQANISKSKIGQLAWNKGLTAETAAHTTWIQNLKKHNESQIGVSYEQKYGPEKAAQIKAKLSALNTGKNNAMYGRPPTATKTYTKAGVREDLGHYVRSSWEADLARVFKYLELNYQYEPHTFELTAPNGHTLTYTPDFYVPSEDKYYEVKGWMDAVSAQKIQLFNEQYPNCELIVIDKTRFAEFQMQYSQLVKWECPEKPQNAAWAEIASIEYVGEEDTYDIEMQAPGNNFVANGFVVHNSGMKKLMTEMRPVRYENIVAAVSLFRPGPMEYIPAYNRRLHGEEPVTYHHPDLARVFGETYGICVSGDAIVFDPMTGMRCRLDEVQHFNEFHIQGVDQDLSPKVARVTHWISKGCKPVYKVRLRNGANIKITHDHRVLTEMGWQPLSDLSAGEYIATPKQLIGPQKQFSLKKLRVLAYLLSDGDIGNLAAVNFVSKDPALLDEYKRCLSVFPNIRATTTSQIREVQRISVAKEDATDYHAPNTLLTWLRDLKLKNPAGTDIGGCRSHEKFVPAFIFELRETDIAFFVASLWDCDGYFGTKLCHYKTISEKLADDVRTLLLRLGIRSVTYSNEYESIDRTTGAKIVRTAYQITVYDTQRLTALLKPHLISQKRFIVCTGRDESATLNRAHFVAEVRRNTQMSHRQLMAQYGIDRQHFLPKQAARPRIGACVVTNIAKALALPETQQQLNVTWEEIISIEPCGEENVYDLTVEGIHNFVADNIIVHNCVYQEQIMSVARDFAGYSMGEADTIRKAVSKKNAEQLAKHKSKFRAGAEKKGYPGEVADAIWADIEFFARYGFNKSHAAIYASITCQTAYLKAKFPTEYLTSLMTAEAGASEKMAALIADAKSHGIDVLPPSVNFSVADFGIQDFKEESKAKSQESREKKEGKRKSAIRFGLTAIKNVGTGPIEAILKARGMLDDNGKPKIQNPKSKIEDKPFKSLDDFCRRVDMTQFNKRALECLIKAGALDEFGPRPQLLAVMDQMIGMASVERKAAEQGQNMLFGMLGGGDEAEDDSTMIVFPKNVKDIPKREMLTWEKELIGTYVSDHPLTAVMASLQSVVSHNAIQLDESANQQSVCVAGVIQSIRPHTSKSGKQMAFGMLEDVTGTVELTVFPKAYEQYQALLQPDKVVVVYGKCEFREGRGAQILVDKVTDSVDVAKATDVHEFQATGYYVDIPEMPEVSNVTLPTSTSKASSIPSTNDVPPPPRIASNDDDDLVEPDGFWEPQAMEGSVLAPRPSAPIPPPQATTASVTVEEYAGDGHWSTHPPASPSANHSAQPNATNGKPANDIGDPNGIAKEATSNKNANPKIQPNYLSPKPSPANMLKETPSAYDVDQIEPEPSIANGEVSAQSTVLLAVPPSKTITPKPKLPTDPLMINITRTGSTKMDIERLQAVHSTLLDFQGTQQFSIRLRSDAAVTGLSGSGMKDMVIDFPNDGTHVCDELHDALRAIGAECVI